MNTRAWQDAVEFLVSRINAISNSDHHSVHVADYAVQIGESAGLSPQTLEELRLGALLHDIGHLLYPHNVVKKKHGSLTEAEQQIIEDHTTKGVEGLEEWSSLAFVKPYIKHHQEWIDGTGYPDGLSGEAIPIEVQILSIADVYEALRHPRPYRNRLGLSHQDAIKEMKPMRGRRWDASLFDLFIDISQNW